MKLALSIFVAVSLLTGAQSVTVTSGSISHATTGSPFNAFGSYSFRIEGRVHSWASADIQAVGIGSLYIRSNTTDNPPAVSVTTNFTGDTLPVPLGVAGCCAPGADMEYRIQRDLVKTNCPQYTVGCYTLEVWNVVTGLYFSDIKEITATASNWTGNNNEVKPQVSVAWLEWYTGVVPVGQGTAYCGASPSAACIPDLTDSQSGDLSSYKFEGNTNDSSAHGFNLGSGPVTYAATPVYVPLCNAGSSQYIQAGRTVTLAGYGLPRDGVNTTTTGLWTQTAGPTAVWVSQRTSFAPVLILPTATNLLTSTASYLFSLLVTDGSGQTNSCTVKNGAVAADSNGVIISGSTVIDELVHQQLQISSTKQPWPWWDDRMIAMTESELNNVYGLRGCTSLDPTVCFFQPWWKQYGPGTITIANVGGVAVFTGSGTTFLSTFGCTAGNAPPSETSTAVEYVPDGSIVPSTNHYRGFPISVCTDDTHITTTLPWTTTLGAITGKYGVGSGTSVHQWGQSSTSSFPGNFYDNVVAYYTMFLRTGIDDYLAAFRIFADEWWEQPTMDQGVSFASGIYTGLDGTPFSQGNAWRAHSMLGVILRALDVGNGTIPTNYLRGLGVMWNLDIYQQLYSNATYGKYGDREGGLQIQELAFCIRFYPSFVGYGSSTCKQSIANWVFPNLALASDPVTGGLITWGTDGQGSYAPACCGQPQQTAEQLGTTVSVVNGSTAVTCANNTGNCHWTAHGVVNTSGTTVNYVSGDLLYASINFSSYAPGQTIVINGVSYIIATAPGGTSLTLTTSAGTQTGVVWHYPITFPTSWSAQFWVTYPGYAARNSGFPAGSNSIGDSRSYAIASITDENHLVLGSPYAGTTAGAQWWNFFISGNSSNPADINPNQAGFGMLPYMESISGHGWRNMALAMTSVGDSASATIAQNMSNTASTWLQNYAQQASTKGTWYFRGSLDCPIVSTPENGNCNHGFNDDARILNNEASTAMIDDYIVNANPATKTFLDQFMNAPFAKPGTCTGDPVCIPDGNYESCLENGAFCMPTWGLGNVAPWKWYGQHAGASLAFSWLAARLGGLLPAVPINKAFGFKLSAVASAAEVTMTISYPYSTATSSTTCTTSPCVLSFPRNDNLGYQIQTQYKDSGHAVLKTTTQSFITRF